MSSVPKSSLDAELVEDTHIAICRGAKLIRSHRDAEILGETLFQHLKRTENMPDMITFEDFSVTYPNNADSSFIHDAFALFDDQDTGNISGDQLKRRCIEVESFLARERLLNLFDFW